MMLSSLLLTVSCPLSYLELRSRKKVREMTMKIRQDVVSVEDTGSCIDPEICPKLFTKFTSKSFSGTGLGLYISKSIIEAHGGMGQK
jgi:signal transduction histidine kinase